MSDSSSHQHEKGLTTKKHHFKVGGLTDKGCAFWKAREGHLQQHPGNHRALLSAA
jgi:hypothetical protein